MADRIDEKIARLIERVDDHIETLAIAEPGDATDKRDHLGSDSRKETDNQQEQQPPKAA